MNFLVNELQSNQIYNLLIGLVAPRPIAWVTTLNQNGTVNAAPFSAYNYVSVNPPIVVLGIAPHPTKGKKDTLINLEREGHFVINVVDEPHLQAMNISATEFESGASEVEIANLELASSSLLKTPRIATTPAALECEVFQVIQVENSHIVLGKVLAFVVKDELVDPSGPYIQSENLHAIGRMNGLGAYVRTENAFLHQARYPSAQAYFESLNEE